MEKSEENMKNIKFDTIIIQNDLEKCEELKEQLKKMCKEAKYVIINTDLNENYEEELEVIKDLVKRKDEFDKAIFDVLTFLKNIVFKHIQRGKTNINFLMQLANMAISRKDRAILKTLLIDYI